MDGLEMKKPSVEEWLHYGDVVIRRLTDCVHIYKNPPYPDVFISDAERQQKTDAIIKLLRRIYTAIDELDVPLDTMPDLDEHDDKIIEKLAPMFGETRQNLGWLSADMQKLLKSPWMHDFPNATAATLFKGEEDESEGIGSGHPDHGRLPAVLAEMQERERDGKTRRKRQDAQRQDETRTTRLTLLTRALLHNVEPKRNDPDALARWVEHNSSHLRTAGRVE